MDESGTVLTIRMTVVPVVRLARLPPPVSDNMKLCYWGIRFESGTQIQYLDIEGNKYYI